MINIAEKLKNVPAGTKLYSLVHGEVSLIGVEEKLKYPIKVATNHHPHYIVTFTNYGSVYTNKGECILFPSKENRNWNVSNVKSKFDIKQLRHFDRVLVREKNTEFWHTDLFSNNSITAFICVGGKWKQCIPYNNETAHLVGTTKDCLDFYKTWK